MSPAVAVEAEQPDALSWDLCGQLPSWDQELVAGDLDSVPELIVAESGMRTDVPRPRRASSGSEARFRLASEYVQTFTSRSPRCPDPSTWQGFDEFFGNLCHLHAEEEPERPCRPTDDKAFTEWRIENAVLMGQMTWHAAVFLETLKEYPPSQRRRASATTRSARASTR